MKKLLSILILICIFSFNTNTEKSATVKLTASQWNVIYNIMEQSNAPHLDVKTAEGWIIQGIGTQLTDSTNKK